MMALVIRRASPFRVQIVVVCRKAKRAIRIVIARRERVVREKVYRRPDSAAESESQAVEAGQPRRLELQDVAQSRIRPYESAGKWRVDVAASINVITADEIVCN